MRFIFVAALTCRLILAQTDAPPVSQASAAPVITVDVAPLRPPDLDSRYASPRDAARHRFQAALAELRTTRNIRTARAGFAEALLADPTYAPAAFDLGVVAAIAKQWEDALAAFEEAGRLDPNGLGREAAPQIARLRLVNSLEATEEGKRKRQYDEALY